MQEDSSGRQQAWRTASLYRPTPVQASTSGASSGSTGGLKRKPSLQTNVVKQVNKPIMSREEVSDLSHQRREQQRMEVEMRERLARNPFLYLMNPQFKDWLSRQQLVVLVIVINLALAILFFKLLT
jgi:junctophilin